MNELPLPVRVLVWVFVVLLLGSVGVILLLLAANVIHILLQEF